jgi:glycerophosphoryl diester phosphodiesterase
VGHRGTRLWAPANTLAAFDAALLMGADAVEMDVRRTRDGVLVLMHDSELARTTDCSGVVEETPWADLEACAVRGLLPGVPEQPIATFAAALNALRGLTVIDVDVKDGTPVLAEQLVEQVLAAGMADQVMVLVRSVGQARLLEALAGGELALLARAGDLRELLAFLAVRDQLNLVAVEIDLRLLPLAPPLARAAGLRTFVDALGACDLIGERCYRRLVKGGADLIQTDRLGRLVPFLDRLPAHAGPLE